MVQIDYNPRGYPVSLTRTVDSYTYLTISAMDAWGHATIIHEGNGATLTRGYSQVTGLMESLTAAGPSATLAQYLYAWDGFGNLATRTDTLANVTQTEGYDDLNRLVSATIGGGASRSYAYDASGNRTQACNSAGSPQCISYAYGAGAAGPHAVSSNSAGGSYSYNANGQMIDNAGQTLTWSAFGKAKTITQGATNLTLSYGPGQRRIHKSVHYQSATRTTTETVTYLQGAKRLSVDGVTSIRRTISLAGVTAIDTGGADAKLLYVITDHLGSTIVLGDDAGTSAQAMSYSPFGRRMSTGHWQGAMSPDEAFGINTSLTDKGYTGQEGLDAVGLWNFNARLYDPALGRFLSVDPLIAHPGSTQAINPYSYVENNPLNKTDPTGMASAGAGCLTEGCRRIAMSGGVGIGGIDWNVTQNKDGSLAVSPSNGPGNILEVSSVTIGVVTVPTGVGQGAKPASTGFDENTHSGKAGKVTSHTSAPTDTGLSSNEPSKAPPNASDPKNYRLYLVALSADGDFPTGHAFIGGITPNGKIEAEGFYASNKNWAGAIIGENVPGKSTSDLPRFKEALQGAKNFAMLRADVDKKTYERVMAEMRNYDQFHKYNLYHDNCVTAAETTWYKNGLSKKRFGDWTPTQLYNRIKGISTGPLSPIYRP